MNFKKNGKKMNKKFKEKLRRKETSKYEKVNEVQGQHKLNKREKIEQFGYIYTHNAE